MVLKHYQYLYIQNTTNYRCMEWEVRIKLFLWIGTFIMFIFSGGVVMFVIFYQNRLFALKKEEAALLLKATLAVEKKERSRFSADLHDGIGGDLNAIKNYLSVLGDYEDDPFKNEIIQDVQVGIRSIIRNTREISHNLMPPLLETSGLIPTLDQYLTSFRKISGVNYNFTYNQVDISLSVNRAYQLYRIIQELTTNMTKYGQVKNFSIQIQHTDNELRLIMIDDGIEFQLIELAKSSSGAGLKNILSRIQAIGAEIEQIRLNNNNQITITLNQLYD